MRHAIVVLLLVTACAPYQVSRFDPSLCSAAKGEEYQRCIDYERERHNRALAAGAAEYQHAPSPVNNINTDPNFCRGLANLAGKDPNTAALECAMTRGMESGNPAAFQSYNAYQQRQAVEQQNQQLQEMERKLWYMEQCQKTGDFCF